MIYLNGTTEAEQAKIYILHENEEWLVPLRAELEAIGVAYEEWFVSDGMLDLESVPPQGIFYNRMSASSHTREHRYAVELTESIIRWLERHGRRVVNNRHSLTLETRKFEQYLQLNSSGLRTPETIAAVGNEAIDRAAAKFAERPFILKPNRGGKGTGVQLFNNYSEYLNWSERESAADLSLDGITLVQAYIAPKDQRITRMEFVGGRFVYAVQVDASGGFELCPADSCQVGDAFCPTTAPRDKFSIPGGYENPDINDCELFLARNGIEIGAIEYVEDQDGKRYYYDVNINTNYNREAELRDGSPQTGMGAIARFLNEELESLRSQRSLKRIAS